MKRLFIAVPLDKVIKEKLTGILSELKYVAFGAKVEPIDNIHITLKFLGNTDEKRIQIINTILNGIAHSYSCFPVEFNEFGFFPYAKYARICWLGMKEPSGVLLQIQKDLEDQLLSQGFAKENREFKPHFTLVRIKNPATGVKLAEKIKEFSEIKFELMTVKYFALYESILKPQGAEYSCVNKYYLKE